MPSPNPPPQQLERDRIDAMLEASEYAHAKLKWVTNTAALVRRLLSKDYADKFILTAIQKLDLALGEANNRNKQQAGYTQLFTFRSFH